MQHVIKAGRPIKQMSVQEYAKFVNVSDRAITKQIRLGKLPSGVQAISFGRFYLIEVNI